VVVADVMTTAKIGPIHGVHPSEKAKPIINDPKKPVGRFLNTIFLSFIKNSKLNIPTITRPKKIMSNAPICLIIFLYAVKKSDNDDINPPMEMNITENPKRKKIVCNKLFRLSIL